MQGNGIKIAITVALLALCGFYLFPSAQSYYYNQKLDDLEGEAHREYLDAHRADIQQARGQSLKLGLDLLGGMHVTLEVQVAKFLSELAQNKDEAFRQALETARRQSASDGGSVIERFAEVYQQNNSGGRLARYFRSETDGIDRRSSNEDVIDYLQNEADEAVGRAIEIVRRRIDQYGVTEPSIQRQGTRRIVVEMPGIDNPQRIRELLNGTARLEFRLMADPQNLAESVQNIVAFYDDYDGPGLDSLQQRGEGASALPSASAGATGDSTTLAAPDSAGDTAAGQGTPLSADASRADSQGAQQQGTRLNEAPASGDTSGQGTALGGQTPEASQNPLAARMLNVLPAGARQPLVGTVAASDTAAVNALLSRPEVQRMLPSGTVLMYDASPSGQQQNGTEVYNLWGLRENVELTGDVVDDSAVNFDQYTNEPKVSITMNSDGARTWSRLTSANVGKQVAIVLDGAVVSNPQIQERIPSGQTEINGLDSRAEAQDIVTVLKSGALPAPVEIVEERTVGPSLGQESIQAGLTSVLVGLLAVALFMIFYYRTGGVVADLALLLNLVLILGILAGFHATLTLPGIAGIVLTIGMAVDANVLIFERIREEQKTGKTLRAAIDAGYARALSAILDANITTFFVGAILYSFGVGPVRGFAVTLMAGILSSMFTAIIVTRVVFDYMVEERKMEVSYG